MTKCKNLIIYEQVGDNKLVTCNLLNEECVYQGKTFNSSSELARYIICNKKGLVEKTEREFYREIKEDSRMHLITDDPNNLSDIVDGIIII